MERGSAVKNLQTRWDSIYAVCERALFPLILLLYPLRHVNVGAEWWDTGYNYGNFLFMERMDPMWVFSTYLGNALGNLMTRLPFGRYMLGMNVYTGLLVSLLALSGYYFFRKKVGLPSGITFLGEFLAVNLCWCPTALLYNYLTYVLLGAGVMSLYTALWEEKKRYFVIAGVCLGVNVFVRFPNLAQMGLILGVWAFGILRKKRFGQVLAETGWCVLGYLSGALLCLGYLAARYGLAEYVGAIARLLGMPSEATDYTLYSMVYYQLVNYLQNLIWLSYLAGFTLLGVLGFAVLPGKWVRLKRAGFVCCVFAGFYFLMQRDMFNMKYSTKLSAFQWSAFLLTATLLIGIVTLLRSGAGLKEKLLLGLGILVIVITPLGSNNHLYSSINNLFFVAPVTLWMIVRLLGKLPGEIRLRAGKKAIGGSLRLFLFPVKAMILCMLFMLGVQSLGFGLGYVFSESDGGENLHTKIENSDILKGMYTSPDRAEVMKTLFAYADQQGLKGHEIILYGGIPALSYYLEMPFAITSWPDLRSYQYSVMEEDLRKVSEQIEAGERELPVILLEAGLKEELESGQTSDAKLKLLLDWAGQYDYRVAFENEKFLLLRAGQRL